MATNCRKLVTSIAKLPASLSNTVIHQQIRVSFNTRAFYLVQYTFFGDLGMTSPEMHYICKIIIINDKFFPGSPHLSHIVLIKCVTLSTPLLLIKYKNWIFIQKNLF